MRRHLVHALSLAADAVIRPHLAAPDLARVRDLRLSRLQQLRRTPAALADRALTAALFAGHGYAQPGLGTTRGLEALTLDAVVARHAAYVRPDRATLVLVGEAEHDELVTAAAAAFGAWRPAGEAGPLTRVPTGATPAARTIFVAREGAPQSEIRCAHLAPARRLDEYPALLVVNAALGGSFSGRLNQRLRQQLGYTYGARSAFDLDRDGGSFTCETSVQADKTAESVGELHQLVAGVCGAQPITADELAFARDALTLGYARHFETPRQVAGALGQLAVYGLDDDEYDAFVPRVRAVTAADAARVAAAYLRPAELITVVVGDPAVAATLGEIETVQPEF
jgi:zinc protease